MKKLNSLARIALAASAATALASGASAVGTDAGTTVSNTFSLDYEVDSTPQTTITPPSSTDFTVDRLVDVALTANNPDLGVPPTSQDRILEFTLTNEGNDNQAYSFSIPDVNGDDFDATGLEITYSYAAGSVTDAPLTSTTVGAGAGSASVTDDIAPDDSITVKISGDIPDGLADASVDDLILLAETRDPVNWVDTTPTGSAAAVTTADGDGSNTIVGAAENVLADGSNTGEEGANDGEISAESGYVVISPNLTASKSVWVLSTASDAATCAGESVPGSEPTTNYPAPGACVLYRIQVTNSGEQAGSDATAIDIADQLPSEIEYVKAEQTGFDTAPSIAATQSDGTTVCDGTEGSDAAPGETCTVAATGGELNAVAGATDAEAYVNIWGLVR